MAERLVPRGGWISAKIQPPTGPTALLWEVYVDFEPFEREGEVLEAYLSCDRIAWPIRDWRHLAGQRLDRSGDDSEPSALFVQPPEVDCDPLLARRTALSLGARDGAFFPVELRLTFDAPSEGLWEGDSLACAIVLPFVGLDVDALDRRERPSHAQEALQRARGLVDLEAFAAPVAREGLGYRLPPRLG